ncbi:IS30 family transposase [Levilactobacillus paucivorans]
MGYHHLTIKERESILELLARGLSIRGVALRLHRSPSTISREIRRIPRHYSPSEAQESYHSRRQHSHKPRLLEQLPEVCAQVIEMTREHHWSPQQISQRLKLENKVTVSYNTIYRHIENHNLNLPFSSHGDTGIRRDLRHKGRKRHHPGDRKHREPKVDYIPIQERPNFVNNRTRIGDWEIDTILGNVGESVLVTAVERLTRYTLIQKAKRKNGQSVNEALTTMFDQIPKEFVLSLTPDHGTEFLNLAEIREKLGVTIYWPDPYAPQQRGTNENTNGLIREYFPKNKSLEPRTDEEIKSCQWQLNHRPRKVLDYCTPEEVLFDEVLHLV